MTTCEFIFLEPSRKKINLSKLKHRSYLAGKNDLNSHFFKFTICLTEKKNQFFNSPDVKQFTKHLWTYKTLNPWVMKLGTLKGFFSSNAKHIFHLFNVGIQKHLSRTLFHSFICLVLWFTTITEE